MSTKNQVVEYYENTLFHYLYVWGLKRNRALHYGLWDENTRNHDEALQNTNRKIAEVSGLDNTYHILDAGCGVGGTAVYLAKNYGCKVTGITISPTGLRYCNGSLKNELKHFINYNLGDYENTGFPAKSFDLVYGIESICHSNNKPDFIREALRILKDKGKIAVIDFFKSDKTFSKQEEHLVKDLMRRWAIENCISIQEFEKMMQDGGLKNIKFQDLTTQVRPSMRRLLWGYYLWYIPQHLYSIFSKRNNVEKDHHKSTYYQYVCIKKNLIKYFVISAEK